MDNWSPLSTNVKPAKRYSVDEYEKAIKNATAAGDAAAASRLQEALRIEQFSQDMRKAMEAGPGSREYQMFAPLAGMGGVERFAQGAGLAARNIGRGAAETVGVDLPPRDELRNRQDEMLLKSPAGVAGNIAGNVGMMLPATALPGANGVVGATLIGGALGALQPTGEQGIGRERAENAAMGAAGGLAGGVLAKGLSRVLNPRGNPAANRLADEGINLTPGQRMGTAANRMEQKMASLPFVGDDIARARGAVRNEWNVATINQVLKPIGEKVNEPGYAGIRAAHSMISKQYDDIAKGIKSVKTDPLFEGQLAELVDMSKTFVPARQRQFQNIIEEAVTRRMTPNGNMSGESFKRIQSDLRRIGTGYMRSASEDERQLGSAVLQLGRNVTDLLKRSDPAKKALLDKADEAWAGLIRIERAAGSVGAADGVFTPSQLLSASKASDQSLRKTASAHGNALLQDWAETAKGVIDETVPNSGTFDRAIIGGGVLGSTLNPGAALPYWGALGAAKAGSMLGYSPAGRGAIGAMLSGRPELMREIGRGIGSLPAPAGAFGGYLAQ